MPVASTEDLKVLDKPPGAKFIKPNLTEQKRVSEVKAIVVCKGHI